MELCNEGENYMARLEGILKLRGSVGGITFCRTQDGYIAKGKGGPDAKKIFTDPVYERTRENFSEFGACVKCGSLLKQATITLNKSSRDARLTPRLNKLMYTIKELDTINVRGGRTVASGINTTQAKELLKTLEFNIAAPLGQVLTKTYSVTTNTGVIQLGNVDATRDIKFPQGATHAVIKGGWARINFTSGAKEFKESNAVNVAKNSAPVNVTLTPLGLPTIQGTDVFVLQVTFMQEIGGVMYELNNGKNNCMKVIGVN